MTRRVLIVSPHFPPVDSPDHHRVRMALPYFQDFGWKPYVLAVAPEYVDRVRDARMEQHLPASVEIFRSRALPIAPSHRVGLGNLAGRCFPYLNRLGARIIREKAIDLVFFSTTLFSVMPLGVRWLRRIRIPFVIDLQDPWLSDYYDAPGAPEPPGGRFKFGLSQSLYRVLEPYTLRSANKVICVSPMYERTLMARYNWLKHENFTTIPFGAPNKDFELLDDASASDGTQTVPRCQRYWVYAGRGGPDMSFALRAFFQALRRARQNAPQVFIDLKIYFVGTDYANHERAKKTVEPIARECGVTDIVTESTTRIPYFDALRLLKHAEALIVPGSDDPGYTASKIYPYILANKPMLAIFHEASSVVEVLRLSKAGVLVTFAGGDSTDSIAHKIEAAWFAKQTPPVPETDWSGFEPYTAREMTRRICRVFDSAQSATI